MIDVKLAVNNVVAFLKHLPAATVIDERLEEVELTDDEKHWLITLSYRDSHLTSERSYKKFTIDAETGEVQSMKIRSV